MHSHSIKHPLWKRNSWSLWCIHTVLLCACLSLCGFTVSHWSPCSFSSAGGVQIHDWRCRFLLCAILQFHRWSCGSSLWFQAVRCTPNAFCKISNKWSQFQASLQYDCTDFSDLSFLAWGFHLLIAEWPKVREHLWNPEELLWKLLLIDLTVCVLVQMTRWFFFFGNVFWWWIKAKKANHNIQMDYYQSCKRHINYSL